MRPKRHWWERILARRPSGERGAVAIIAAAVMGGGLLFGMGALVIDVGKLYDEREQLSSGADLASWALAKRCITAATRSLCGAQATLAATLASSNAKDSATNISAICGRFTGLSSCATQTSKLSDCLGSPPATANYLQVQTSTKEADGTTKVPPVFSNLLNSSNTGSSVGACARVAWGIPNTATPLAIGIGRCEFYQLTNSGLVYSLVSGVGGLLTGVLGDTGTAVAGLLGAAPPATGQLIFIHDTIGKVNTSPACNAGAPASPPPWTGGNGFGFLQGAYSDANCLQTMTVGDVLPASDLGALAPVNCLTSLQNAVNTGAPILVPIYDYQWNPLINLDAYTVRIAGFAAFVVKGYQLGLLNGVLKTVGSLLGVSGNPQCAVVLDFCLNGYFTQAIIPAPSVSVNSLGTTDYGVSLITRIG
ncbi:pilus assembly protein TadG-related protein [Cryptosporangium sp. NPDC048952]|uniref:pilus assembly protein TadG-related protein n=1 Tax=Cryptosporangium sp. NPDC048952 TaxID=3363961 RepID=UPI0037133C96